MYSRIRSYKGIPYLQFYKKTASPQEVYFDYQNSMLGGKLHQ